MTRRLAPLAVAALLVACGAPPGPQGDAGPVDAGPPPLLGTYAGQLRTEPTGILLGTETVTVARPDPASPLLTVTRAEFLPDPTFVATGESWYACADPTTLRLAPDAGGAAAAGPEGAAACRRDGQSCPVVSAALRALADGGVALETCARCPGADQGCDVFEGARRP